MLYQLWHDLTYSIEIEIIGINMDDIYDKNGIVKEPGVTSSPEERELCKSIYIYSECRKDIGLGILYVMNKANITEDSVSTLRSYFIKHAEKSEWKCPQYIYLKSNVPRMPTYYPKDAKLKVCELIESKLYLMNIYYKDKLIKTILNEVESK